MEISFELSALAGARRYSRWIYSAVAPYLGSRILELGAGIGNLSQWLPRRELLLLTEGDEHLFSLLQEKFRGQASPQLAFRKIDLNHGLQEQVREYGVDTVVSFNVMEHIENDVASFREQIEVLKQSTAPGPKRLVVFVPAHSCAYGSFDVIFQHYRRYDASRLHRIFREIDPQLRVKTFYFNMVSMLGWIWYGRVIKSTKIDPKQIALLEKIIPFWRPFDYLFNNVLRLPFGQSVIAVVEI